MELPPYNPKTNISRNSNQSGISSANNSDTGNVQNYLKKHVGQQIQATVAKSQANISGSAASKTNFQTTLVIPNSPNASLKLEATSPLPLIEGQTIKLEVISPDQLRILQLQKPGLENTLNQYLKQVLANQRSFSAALRFLQQFGNAIEQLPKQQQSQLNELQQAISKLTAQIITLEKITAPAKMEHAIQTSGLLLENKIKSLIKPTTTAGLEKILSKLDQSGKNKLSQSLRQLLTQDKPGPNTNDKVSARQPHSSAIHNDLKANLNAIKAILEKLGQGQASINSSREHPAEPGKFNAAEAVKSSLTVNSKPESRSATNNEANLTKKDSRNRSAKQSANPGNEATKQDKSNNSQNATKTTPKALPPIEQIATATKPNAQGKAHNAQPPSSAHLTALEGQKANNKTFGPYQPPTLTKSPSHSSLFAKSYGAASGPAQDSGSTQPFFLTHSSTPSKLHFAPGNRQGSVEDFIDSLLKQVNASLARIQFNQLHTLLNLVQANPGDPATPQSSLQTEIPIHLSDGSIDVVQLTIEEEAHADEQDPNKQKQWKINLRFDFEELGLVHIQLILFNDEASATIWAEQKQSVTAFSKHIEKLNDGLQKIGLTVNETQCLLGMPLISKTRIDQNLVDIKT